MKAPSGGGNILSRQNLRQIVLLAVLEKDCGIPYTSCRLILSNLFKTKVVIFPFPLLFSFHSFDGLNYEGKQLCSCMANLEAEGKVFLTDLSLPY
jgi:hypothetical protein